jgi:hypothetical protein
VIDRMDSAGFTWNELHRWLGKAVDTAGYMWNDLLWRLDKAELLERTREWNEALEKYCNDMGLTGAERATVVQKHTANHVHLVQIRPATIGKQSQRNPKTAPDAKPLLIVLAIAKRKIGRRSTSPSVWQPRISEQ